MIIKPRYVSFEERCKKHFWAFTVCFLGFMCISAGIGVFLMPFQLKGGVYHKVERALATGYRFTAEHINQDTINEAWREKRFRHIEKILGIKEEDRYGHTRTENYDNFSGDIFDNSDD